MTNVVARKDKKVLGCRVGPMVECNVSVTRQEANSIKNGLLLHGHVQDLGYDSVSKQSTSN